MAKFHLNRKEKETSVIGTIFAFNKRYRYDTRIRVISKFWNPRTYRLRETMEYPEAGNINYKLDSWSALLDEVFAEITKTVIQPTNDDFKQAVIKKVKQVTEGDETPQSLVKYAERWVKQVSRSERTLKGHVTILNTLIRYEKSNGMVKFSDIGMSFYNTYKKHLEQKKYSVNTIGENFKCIKVWMDAAREEGLHSNIGYKHKDFRVVNEDSDSIYLTMDELIRLNNLVIDYDLVLDHYKEITKVKGNMDRRIKALIDVRDRFLIGSLTALRFQDYSTLSNLNERSKEITVRSLKTGTRTTIPIHYIIKEILARRNGVLPPAISNQRFNQDLKVLGNIAEINEMVETSITKGGKRVSSWKPKYKLITSHTARRTGCTLMYLNGVPTRVIMSFSGHRTEKNFLKYIKVRQFEDAMRMKDHPFFTGR